MNTPIAYSTDEFLVLAYQEKKDPLIFGQLYSIYFQRIYKYICKITADKDLSFDLTQDVFILAAAKLDTLNKPITFQLWLFRIARNTSLQYIKKQKNHLDFDSFEYGVEEEGFDVDKEAYLDLVEQSIHQLTPDEQYIIKKRYYEDVSILELCKELHLGESALKMKILRLRQKLNIMIGNKVA